MADLGINSQNVISVKPVQNITIVLGEQTNAASPLYLGSDGLWRNALANGNAVQSGINGLVIALVPGYVNQSILAYQNPFPGGGCNLGNSGVNGTIYCVSPNAGRIAPATDLVAGMFVSVLGVMSNGVLVSPGSGMLASGQKI